MRRSSGCSAAAASCRADRSSDLPRCWAIVRTGSGTDNVPVEEATARGIVVANTPPALSDGVSDHVIALLMALVRRLPRLDREVRAGVFDQTLSRPLNSFRGRTFGLVGFGHIARDVARKLSGFGMKWLVHDPFVNADDLAALGAQAVSLETLLVGVGLRLAALPAHAGDPAT